MSWTIIAAVALAVWNTCVFALYGQDKAAAKRGANRISENTLFLAAACMGALGALFGMYIFHHKTRHPKFKLGVPVLMIVNTAVAVFIVYGAYFKIQ